VEFIDFRMPDAGFAQPLLLWMACHDRGQRVALLLQRLFDHLSVHGPSDATRVTGAEVRRYLTEATPRHHADEDLDLFPRLKRQIDRRGKTIAGADRAVRALDRLHQEHRRFDDLTESLQAALVHSDQAVPTDRHHADAGEFVDRFIAHHAVESEILLPVARDALEPADLAAIGDSMAARRGTTWAALSSPNGRA